MAAQAHGFLRERTFAFEQYEQLKTETVDLRNPREVGFNQRAAFQSFDKFALQAVSYSMSIAPSACMRQNCFLQVACAFVILRPARASDSGREETHLLFSDWRVSIFRGPVDRPIYAILLLLMSYP